MIKELLFLLLQIMKAPLSPPSPSPSPPDKGLGGRPLLSFVDVVDYAIMQLCIRWCGSGEEEYSKIAE